MRYVIWEAFITVLNLCSSCQNVSLLCTSWGIDFCSGVQANPHFLNSQREMFRLRSNTFRKTRQELGFQDDRQGDRADGYRVRQIFTWIGNYLLKWVREQECVIQGEGMAGGDGSLDQIGIETKADTWWENCYSKWEKLKGQYSRD